MRSRWASRRVESMTRDADEPAQSLLLGGEDRPRPPRDRRSSSSRSVTAWSWYRSKESHPSSWSDSSSWARTPSGLARVVLQATNRRSRTAGTWGPTSSWARPYWGAMSRWFTPAASAAWKAASVTSGVERAEGGRAEDGDGRLVLGASEAACLHGAEGIPATRRRPETESL